MSSIGLLGNLNGFDASLNQLTGQLPLGLSNCTNLRAISLSNNMLRGEIPISIIQGLAKSCNSFELAHNNLTGLIPNTEFQHMTFLQTLDLSYNQLSGPVPSGLAGCLGLQSLNLSQNKLVGPITSELGGALLSLIDLDLSHNYINGSIPEELGRLQSLQELDLSSNALSGTIPLELANLKGLRYLNLSYNSQLQGKVPDGGIFGNLTKMSFLGNPMLCGIAVNKTCTISSTSDGLSKEWKIVIIVASALIFHIIVLVSILILLHYYRRNLKKERAEGKASWDFDPYLRLTLEDIRQATSNFSADNILGAGATGTVYKGILRDGTILAFKKFNLDNSSIQSFFGELESVGRIRHRNLIKILGYFSNQVDANILILEYMPNGSLQDHLHGQDHVGLSSWDARLRVARSVAEGLFYLHNDGPTPIIHCDLKPQNILFDEKMEVHITLDFGLAKVLSVLTATSSLTENVKGTFGYMAPEMASFGHISRKCDIYSYGILLMELIGGRSPLGEGHAVEFSSGEDEGTTTSTALVQWVSVKYDADEMLAIVDKRLQETIGENEINQMKELLHLALQCTQTNPKQRPIMQQVQQVLSSGSVASSIDKAKELLIRLENPSPDTPERDSF
ncbi:hypothetical protein L7F22_040812 [Adiantum nelumboides]|nr:hypothetical protein [Adiantum nelumboides]